MTYFDKARLECDPKITQKCNILVLLLTSIFSETDDWWPGISPQWPSFKPRVKLPRVLEILLDDPQIIVGDVQNLVSIGDFRFSNVTENQTLLWDPKSSP